MYAVIMEIRKKIGYIRRKDVECPECKNELDEEDDYYTCDNCYNTYNKCSVCGIPVPSTTMNSDICGHASCVEKKTERMFG
jgi:hypothetical protein